MADNAHAGMVAHQLAVDAGDDDEAYVIEVPITLHRNDQGLHAWVDESAVGDEVADGLDIAEVERRLFNRFPEDLLQNAEKNLEPEWSRSGAVTMTRRAWRSRSTTQTWGGSAASRSRWRTGSSGR